MVQHHCVGTHVSGLIHGGRIGHPSASVGMAFAFHIVEMPLGIFSALCAQHGFQLHALFRVGHGHRRHIHPHSMAATRFQSSLPEGFIVNGRAVRRSGTTSIQYHVVGVSVSESPLIYHVSLIVTPR